MTSPLIHPLHDTGSGRYVPRATALDLIALGCVFCGVSFVSDEINVLYETSDLHVIGLDPVSVAELHLALIEKETPRHDLIVSSTSVFIVDRKAAVCQECWIKHLKQIASLRERIGR